MLERGVENVSIDDVVTAAGMAKGSFYRYFGDKVQLVETAMEPLSSALLDATSECAAALRSSELTTDASIAYQRMAARLGVALVSHPQQLRLYLQECRGPSTGARVPIRALADAVASAAIELSELAMERGIVRARDCRVSALAVVGASERLMFEALVADTPLDPSSAALSLIDLVFNGVRPGN